MSRINLGLSPSEEKELSERVKSLGVTLTSYVRNTVRDSLKRNPETAFSELNRSVRALVPTLAQVFGVTQGKEKGEITELKAHLLKIFDQERK